MWTPTQFVSDYIPRWEGGLSLDPSDKGNWLNGKLVGSKYGVTGAILSSYRGKPVTAADMASLTLSEAVAIAIKMYYHDDGMSNLAWNRVAASVMDFGWTAGPHRAILKLQALVGSKQDGVISIGGETATKFKALCADEASAAKLWCAARIDYYEDVVVANPVDKKYLNGWTNRSNYFLPDSVWWNRFAA